MARTALEVAQLFDKREHTWLSAKQGAWLRDLATHDDENCNYNPLLKAYFIGDAYRLNLLPGETRGLLHRL